jgi:hypothetical protein
LYQWLIAGRDAATIEAQPLDDSEIRREHKSTPGLLHGAVIAKPCARDSLRTSIACRRSVSVSDLLIATNCSTGSNSLPRGDQRSS